MEAFARIFTIWSKSPIWGLASHAVTAVGTLMVSTYLLSSTDTGMLVQLFQKVISNLQTIVVAFGEIAVAVGGILAILGPIFGYKSATTHALLQNTAAMPEVKAVITKDEKVALSVPSEKVVSKTEDMPQ